MGVVFPIIRSATKAVVCCGKLCQHIRPMHQISKKAFYIELGSTFAAENKL